MLYSKLNNKTKSFGSAKTAVVSCALFSNALLSGCAHNSSFMQMKLDTNSERRSSNDKNTSSLHLTENDLGDGISSDTGKKSDKTYRSKLKGHKPKADSSDTASTTKTNWKLLAALGFFGVAAIGLGTALGIEEVHYKHEVSDLKGQVAYLEDENNGLSNNLDKTQLYLNNNVTLLGQTSWNLATTQSYLSGNQTYYGTLLNTANNYLSGNITLLDQTRDDLESEQANSTNLAGQLTTTQATLTTTQATLTTTQAALTTTEAALTTTQADLTTTQNDLSQARNSLASTVNPDHFVTLGANVIDNNVQVNLNYSNYIKYVGTNDKVTFTVDQTSLSDLHSINIVAALLQPTGPVQFNLNEIGYSICGGNVLDLSGFTSVNSITLNGYLYIKVVGPIDKDVNTDSTTSVTNSIYNYANNFFTINSKICGGSRSVLKSANTVPVSLSDSSTSTAQIVAKLGGAYNMQLADFQNCFTNNIFSLLDSTTGFFSNTGFLGDGVTPITASGTVLLLNNAIKYPSNSMIYDLTSQMINLKYLFMNGLTVSGAQFSEALTNMDDAGDNACIQYSNIIGNVNVPSNVVLDCSKFVNSTAHNWTSDPDFLHGSLLSNSQFTITQSSGDTTQSRVPIPSTVNALDFDSSVPNYGVNGGSAFVWSNGTSFGANYAPIDTSYVFGGTPYLGDCSTTA